MPSQLVIVESPVKAQTIEKYLGQGYKVVSCNGHIRDLPSNELAVDIEAGFLPKYVINPDKKVLIAELTKQAKAAPLVYLASDDDREGESIAWHLQEALSLTPEKTHRIVFREITKPAIERALAQPRTIDTDLVESQWARRVLDRLVGYDVSPVLWKKIKNGLSAGRVQTVAVRLVVEREREIQHFVPKSSYKINAHFASSQDTQLEAELADNLPHPEEARHFLERCAQATFTVDQVKRTATSRTPAPPFTTSTLQQECSRVFGFSVSRTMLLAQRLYEEGHITYMRTDSVNLAEEALAAAGQVVTDLYGAEFHHTNRYKTRAATAQEAHEAIRPTYFSNRNVSSNPDLQRLYTLIWQRTVASQMAAATFAKTTALIAISTLPHHLVAEGLVMTFQGFLAAYHHSTAAVQKFLPPLNVGDTLELLSMEACERFTRPPARYTEATLVRELEERGIGRPSTYAPIVTTIQERNYVSKEDRAGKERTYQRLYLSQGSITTSQEREVVGVEHHKLFPTDTAMVVNDFLVQHFPDITDYSFTAQVEEQLDHIAHHAQQWQAMLRTFYNKFSPQVTHALNAASNELPHTVRPLGQDPATGLSVVARLSRRHGPLIQLGGEEENVKPRFASLRPGQFLEQITLQEALELFKLPRQVGSWQGDPITANIGRFGPYLRYRDAFYTLSKELDPYTVTEGEAIEMLERKQRDAAQKIAKSFDEAPHIQVCKGPWGHYIQSGKQRVKLPKEQDLDQLTLAECQRLLAQGSAPTTKRKGSRKASKSK